MEDTGLDNINNNDSNQTIKKKKKKVNRKKTKQTMPMTLNEKLALYLNAALAMENSSVTRLEERIRECSFEDSKIKLQQHLDETCNQQKRLQELITDLGGQPTEENAKLPLLILPKPLDRLNRNFITAQETQLAGIRDDAMIENAEVVVYDVLIHIMQQFNKEAAVSILTQSIEEEQNMVRWYKSNTGSIVAQILPDIEQSTKDMQPLF